MKKIAIIGAGISGLFLGYMLKNYYDITIFEKSNGTGGRMACRRKDDFMFDHGAQFFTAKTKRFQDFLKDFIEAGIVAEWKATFAVIENYEVNKLSKWGNGLKHFVSCPNFTSLSKILSIDLNIVLNKLVTRIENYNKQNILFSNDESLGTYDLVISSIPPKQAVDILPTNYIYLENIKKKEMLPGFALMLLLSNNVKLGFDAAIVKGSDISWITSMNSKPQRPKHNSIVALSTNLWAESNFDMDKNIAMDYLTKELRKIFVFSFDEILHIDLHKWRYANIKKQHGLRSYFDRNNSIGCIGDWCVEGKVEGAFLSSLDMYYKIKKIDNPKSNSDVLK
jgi:predicted NAD/FAD-dependent oxidoreductase